MLSLNVVYIDGNECPRTVSLGKVQTSNELTQLAHAITQRTDLFLERQGCWSGMPRTAIWHQMQWKRGR
jgi:hypothetical protein